MSSEVGCGCGCDNLGLPVGTAGENGTNGANGLSVINGTGAPLSGTGEDGEFYIDTLNWYIYGPKSSGSWPTGVSMRGQNGIAVFDNLLTPVGTAANTTETILQTITAVANTLPTNGSKFYVRALFRCAANGNTKTISVNLPANTFSTSGVLSGFYVIQVEISRITATTYQAVAQLFSPAASSILGFVDTQACDFSSTFQVTARGQNGTASANDIICEQLTMDFGLKA